jgi:predicted permease
MPDWKVLIRQRLAPLGLNANRESELAEELAQHLEDHYRELRSGGASDREAYEGTLAELEDMSPLRTRVQAGQRLPKHDHVPAGDNGGRGVIRDVGRDLRYALRTMRKSPVFVLFTVGTLGLGIGANTTVFTIVNTLFLNPLPAPRAAELAAVVGTDGRKLAQSAPRLLLSFADFRDYRARNAGFDALAGYTSPRALTYESGSGSERMFAELVTGDYFSALELTPVRGRFFLPEEDGAPGAHPVAVMNYATWQRHFGAQDMIGKTLRLNNVPFTVIGVAPRPFIGVNGIFGPDFWIPAAMAERLLPGEMQGALADRAKPVLQGVGRLKKGLTRMQAEANLATIASALQHEYPLTNAGRTVRVTPVTDVMFGSENSSTGRTPMLFGSAVLLIVAAIILLIACSNVASLLLARSAARHRELALRLAIGANGGRLVRQLLTESVFLGGLSGVAGILIGYESLRLLWTLGPAEVAANLVQPKLDIGVLAVSMLVSLATGLIFGVVPAIRASRLSVSEALKEDARTAGRSARRITFANVLLVGQVAFSFVSLMTAALFLRSIRHAYEIDPGFQTGHLAIVMTYPGQAGYGKTQTKEFYRVVRERVSAIPGVESVSWATNLPLWGRVAADLEVEGREPRSKNDGISTIVNTVDVDYFNTTGIRVTQGRDFTPMDRDSTEPVAIVNEKLARDSWPGQEATRKHVRLPGENVRRRVVGVVGNANYSSLAEAPQACVYVPLEQRHSDAMVLFVRTLGDPQGSLAAVQKELRAIGPKVGVDDVRTGSKIVDQALFGAKAGVAMLSVFGLLALILASVGLYGIMAYTVACRRQEIGVRMALGAGRAQVLGLVLKQGLSLVLAGVAIGAVGAIELGRMLSGMLYGIGASDPASILAAAGMLLAVALAACYLPARSASRVDPLVALREG